MGLRELVARSRVLAEDTVLTSPRLAFRPRLADGMRVGDHTGAVVVRARLPGGSGGDFSAAQPRGVRRAWVGPGPAVVL